MSVEVIYDLKLPLLPGKLARSVADLVLSTGLPREKAIYDECPFEAHDHRYSSHRVVLLPCRSGGHESFHCDLRGTEYAAITCASAGIVELRGNGRHSCAAGASIEFKWHC